MIADLPYGRHARHRFDLYMPSDPVRRKRPVVTFFYGGSWQSGTRAEYKFVGRILARLGYLVAIPDYRLYPEIRYPDFINDAAFAVARVAEIAPKHGGDPDAVFVAGHSAGAYIALMLALAPDFLVNAGFDRTRLAGAIGLAGPYDFLPITGPVHQRIFATAPDLALTQPIAYVGSGIDSNVPPCLLLHGARDQLVLPANTASLAAGLRSQGGMVQTRIYPGIGHVGALLGLLPFMSWRAAVLREIRLFIDEVLRDARSADSPDRARDMAGRAGLG